MNETLKDQMSMDEDQPVYRSTATLPEPINISIKKRGVEYVDDEVEIVRISQRTIDNRSGLSRRYRLLKEDHVVRRFIRIAKSSGSPSGSLAMRLIRSGIAETDRKWIVTLRLSFLPILIL